MVRSQSTLAGRAPVALWICRGIRLQPEQHRQQLPDQLRGHRHDQTFGRAKTYITVNAPNADVQIKGGTDLYGSIIAKTISDLGGTRYHFDTNSKLGPPSNGTYSEIAFRDVNY
jgi:hypothetical protein